MLLAIEEKIKLDDSTRSLIIANNELAELHYQLADLLDSISAKKTEIEELRSARRGAAA